MRPASRTLGLAMALTILVLIGLTLWVGVRVGSATAWDITRGDRGSPGLLVPRRGPDRLLRDGHGAVGQIETVDALSIKMVTREGKARDVVVSTETLIFRGHPKETPPTKVGDTGLSAFAELQPGARIVVMGQPNDAGQLEARILRVLIFDPNREKSFPPPDRIPPDRKWRGQP